MTAPVGEVMTPITVGQIRQELLARLVEQSLGGEFLLALFQQRHQRAEAGRLQRLDDDLILRAAGIGGQPAGDDHFETGLELELDPRRGAAPDHAGDAGALVLEIEINVAVAVIAHLAEFAAHAHIAVGVLDGALERRRKFRDGQFRQIEARFSQAMPCSSSCLFSHALFKLMCGYFPTMPASGGHSRFSKGCANGALLVLPLTPGLSMTSAGAVSCESHATPFRRRGNPARRGRSPPEP